MSPTLPEVLAELAGTGTEAIRVVPLFLAPGAHTSRDLPALVGQVVEQWPALRVEIAPTLLESQALRAAVVAALQPPPYNSEL
jgi:sirohydrochlorin cobaltochelatase